MIIWSSINCPIVICLPTVCYFSREKPLVKSTAPGPLLYHIFLRDLFLFTFIFRSINPKTKNTLLQFLFIYFISRSREIYLFNLLQFYLSFFLGGIDNPSFTSGWKYLFFVCRYHLHPVAWFPYWIDTLVSQPREIPTIVVLHHPFLFGEISMQFQAISITHKYRGSR